MEAAELKLLVTVAFVLRDYIREHEPSSNGYILLEELHNALKPFDANGLHLTAKASRA